MEPIHNLVQSPVLFVCILSSFYICYRSVKWKGMVIVHSQVPIIHSTVCIWIAILFLSHILLSYASSLIGPILSGSRGFFLSIFGCDQASVGTQHAVVPHLSKALSLCNVGAGGLIMY